MDDDCRLHRGQKKDREKLRKESEERGEARDHEEWDAWLARREDSEATGEPFSEPLPSKKSDTD